VAVADAFDAITNSRPYRPARSARVAMQLLRNDSDRHFEARLVDAVEHIVSAESHLYDVSSRSASVA
jgi:putative two-component system response regulator